MQLIPALLYWCLQSLLNSFNGFNGLQCGLIIFIVNLHGKAARSILEIPTSWSANIHEASARSPDLAK